jgi:hypothetical protein
MKDTFMRIRMVHKMYLNRLSIDLLLGAAVPIVETVIRIPPTPIEPKTRKRLKTQTRKPTREPSEEAEDPDVLRNFVPRGRALNMNKEEIEMSNFI